MCILFVYTNPNPEAGGYRLIVASNRDEYYTRPAKTAYLCPDTNIIGGRDMTSEREGGMWLGAAVKPPKVAFAALLNVTGEEKKTSSVMGRGPIVYNYLANSDTALQYFDSLKAPKVYNAFNVVVVEVTRGSSVAYHYSNTPEDTIEYSGKQVLAFGNSTPRAPLTKVERGKARFEKIIEKTKDKQELVKELLGLLKCRDSNLADPELQRRAPAVFEQLSSIFVQIEDAGYGTRTHSVILVDSDCNVEFIEHTMKDPIDIKNPVWEVTVIKSQL